MLQVALVALVVLVVPVAKMASGIPQVKVVQVALAVWAVTALKVLKQVSLASQVPQVALVATAVPVQLVVLPVIHTPLVEMAAKVVQVEMHWRPPAVALVVMAETALLAAPAVVTAVTEAMRLNQKAALVPILPVPLAAMVVTVVPQVQLVQHLVSA